ncbi:hypothetical protein C8J57DRAFT_975833, partial [Mycena rebaudengoi]
LISLNGRLQQHANEGCIIVDATPICAPDHTTIRSGSAVISARFDGSSDAERIVPGCAFHADVYVGADNCLYDSAALYTGQNIDGQWCEAGTGGILLVLNPY